MGFGNWDLVEIGQKGRREWLRWDLGIEMWDVGILGFGRDKTKRKIREYVRKRR